MRTNPPRLTGPALIAGGLIFLLFWIVNATESASPGIPWPVALTVHGIQIITLGAGLVMAMSLPIRGWPRYLWLLGLGIATLGNLIGLPLFATGVLLVGVGAILTAGYRIAGLPMIPGAILWLLLFSRGAMIGNEDYPPLTESEQVLALSGLVLMVVGLVTLGVIIVRNRQVGLAGSSRSGSEGPRTNSQSTPATTTPPTANSQTGES